MKTDNEIRIDRRDFLKRGATSAFGIAGWTAQDDPERARYARRMAFDYPERLGEDLRRKIILLTDKTNDDPDVSEVDSCAFANWPTDELTIWEGIIVEWEGPVDGFFGRNPNVRAQQLVQRKQIFVDEKDTPPELGTPYIISGLVDCQTGFAGVRATQIPGIDIKTGPDVSTGDGASDSTDPF
jgi:hypothetical protein